MGLADLRKRDRAQTEKLLKKSKPTKTKAKTKTMITGGSQPEKIRSLCRLVESRLGKYADDFICLQTKDELHSYIDSCIKTGYISLDTETTGLDPITDKIVGACIYTPGEKAAYVPINHVSLISKIRLDNQLSESEVRDEFQRLLNNKVKGIYFNAKFDIRVTKNQLGIVIPPFWDGMIAGKVLKENEEEANLKYLWKKYCSPDKDAEHFTFEKMFQGYSFDLIPIKTAYLYAAKDAIMTWELFKFQEPYLTVDNPTCIECDFTRLAKLYNEIEMPIIQSVADIEDRGVALDTEYTKELSVKYNQLLKEKLDVIYTELDKYKGQIISYKATHPQTKLEDPINVGSPVQLAEIFYDVLKLDPVSRKQPRGTGEEILKKLNHPLCKPILDYRGVVKLLSTYIDKMPLVANKKTGRIHCHFKQYGADCVLGDTIIPNLEFPGKSIKEICNSISNMDDGVLYPLQITIINRYGNLESTSHCIKFSNCNVIKLTFNDGSELGGTYNHPILMDDNIFKELQYIEIGDKVKSINSKILEVTNIDYIEGTDVYDFKVPQTHSFVSNSVISHNTGRFACISAGSMISMPGGDKPIQNVEVGDWVYCYKGNKLTLSRVKNIWFTGTKKCVKLHWVSKYNKKVQGDLICTPDHYIRTTNGWVQAKDIKPTDSILHVHRHKCNNKLKHIRLSAHFGQGNEEEHIWIKNNYFQVDKTSNLHIHHKDCNRFNNSPDNLVICTPKEHINIHRRMENGYYGAYDFTKDQLYIKCENANWDIRNMDYDGGTLITWLKKHRINYIKKYSDNYINRPTTIRNNGKPFKYKSLPMTKENLMYALSLANYNIQVAASYFGDNSYKFESACNKYKLLDNHNVVSIQYLDDLYPVYDLEIEGYHNFIANELCVHNSSDPNLQNIPSHEKSIRKMFIASRSTYIESDDNILTFLWADVIPTTNGKKFSHELIVGDIIVCDDGNYIITNIEVTKKEIKVYVDKGGQ